MKNIVEALLIATDVPLTLDRICEIVGHPGEEVRQAIDDLNREYKESGRAFEIKEIAGGFQIYTLPQYAEWIVALHKKKERLSKAALETLAVVAYHQPVTRADVERARGVDSSWILESLMQKGLVKTCGRLDAPGRPIKYGTTRDFLRYFSLNDLTDLPKEEDFGLNVPVAEDEPVPAGEGNVPAEPMPGTTVPDPEDEGRLEIMPAETAPAKEEPSTDEDEDLLDDEEKLRQDELFNRGRDETKGSAPEPDVDEDPDSDNP
jgi:segregation and condensation protein B